MSDGDNSRVSKGGKDQLLDLSVICRLQAWCRFVENHNLSRCINMIIMIMRCYHYSYISLIIIPWVWQEVSEQGKGAVFGCSSSFFPDLQPVQVTIIVIMDDYPLRKWMDNLFMVWLRLPREVISSLHLPRDPNQTIFLNKITQPLTYRKFAESDSTPPKWPKPNHLNISQGTKTKPSQHLPRYKNQPISASPK